MLITYIRAVVVYLVLVLSIRLMGKRQIGQLEASEFVVTMLVANLASVPMQDPGVPLYAGLVPIGVVLGLELCLSGLTLRSIVLRRLLCGKPVILIDNGKIRPENLRRTRVTLDELQAQLRQKDVLEVEQVQYAILENDGSLSVFPWSPTGTQQLPVTLIQDGHLFRRELKAMGRDENWLEKTLRRHGAAVSSTLLLTLDREGKVVWLGKEAP